MSHAEDQQSIIISADLGTLLECLEALRATSSPPCAVEVTLVRSVGQAPGYAWLGFVTHHRTGWWERNGLAVEADGFGAGRRIVVDLGALAEAVAAYRWAYSAATVRLEWCAEGLVLFGHVIPAEPGGVPALPEVSKVRDRAYLAPGAGSWRDVVVETEQGRIGIPSEVVAHLHQRGTAVAEFGVVDGDVYLVAQAEQRGKFSAAPVIVAPVELLMWSDEPERDGFRERRRPGNEVQQLLAAIDPATPPAMLLELLDTGIGYVRRRAAAHPGLPTPVIDALAERGTSAMRGAVAANPGLTGPAVRTLVVDPEASVRACLAGNAVLAPDVVASLARDPDAGVREAAVENPRLSAEARSALAEDPAPGVRRAVAAYRGSDTALLARLARDVDPRVCRAVAANPSSPVEVLDDLAPVLPQIVLGNPNASARLLVVGARASDGVLRSLVGANPATPERVLATLARDREAQVLRAVADNPSTPRAARRRAEKRLAAVEVVDTSVLDSSLPSDRDVEPDRFGRRAVGA